VCDDLVAANLAQKNHAFVRQFFDNFLDSVYADDALAPSGSIRTSDPASSLVIRPAGERHLKNPDADHLNELREVDVVGAAPSESVLGKLLPFERISSFRCIKRLVDKYHMKREELAELIDGFKLDMDMDRREVKIGTTDDLIHYSCCVAASVGVMCCRIFNIPSHRTDVYERARDMGIALQLTNIARYPTRHTARHGTARHDTTHGTARHDTRVKARQADWVRQHRDIVTDAKIGRVYVPLQWFESEQERQELLDHPWKNPGRLRQFAESLIGLSAPYYRRAGEGVAMLPHEVRTVCVIVCRVVCRVSCVVCRVCVCVVCSHVCAHTGTEASDAGAAVLQGDRAHHSQEPVLPGTRPRAPDGQARHRAPGLLPPDLPRHRRGPRLLSLPGLPLPVILLFMNLNIFILIKLVEIRCGSWTALNSGWL
jgi:phytoene/squalene synthetase